jgi:serine/threonine protein kinase
MDRDNRDLLFDRYEKKRILGEGYFGRVFLAHDKKLGRDLAIKELKSEFLSDEKTLQRFSNDARFAASIGHPNIVIVYDMLPDAKPQFILMELMPNGTLQELLKRKGKLPIQEALIVALSLCRALKAAHGKGIIHRDIKPGNILLGDEGVIKLADFGIAHLPEQYRSVGDAYADRHHPCTPAYASPEQVLGLELDGRSDLYTVGVVLHELVTGSFYFDRVILHTVGDRLKAVLHHDPIPPRSINNEVPPRLDDIIMCLLQKTPSRRYKDASTLIDELEDVSDAPTGRRGTVSPHITSISTTAQREAGTVRYRIRIEAENRGEGAAVWSGLTLNLPCISTREKLNDCELNVSCSRKGAPVLRAPGEMLNGVRSDGSFGQMEATCLLVETPATPWQPRERVFLDVSFLVTDPDVEAHVRAWASWESVHAQYTTNGDPDWSQRGLRDQQGVPAHRIMVSLQPR